MDPPRDEAELMRRAFALEGLSIHSLSRERGVTPSKDSTRSKGKVGELVERALGATGGSQRMRDFPELGVELKTIPLDARAWPRESTFVCAVSLIDADRSEWATSWVRAKLARVLWLPVHTDAPGERRVGRPILWSPSPEQERGLADDFEEIMGRIGAGNVEGLTAHVGRWMQLRPKAAHGRVRTRAPGADGEVVSTVPRGFYLRTGFTGAILRDPSACPEMTPRPRGASARERPPE
jgi:DNA mismatch repair protein MutH